MKEIWACIIYIKDLKKDFYKLEDDSIRSKAISLIIYLLKKKKSYELSTDCIQSKITVHCNNTTMSENTTDVNRAVMQVK